MKLTLVRSVMFSAFVASAFGLGGCAVDDDGADDETTDASHTEEALTAGCATCGIEVDDDRSASIRGIRVGMTKKRVREILGDPGQVQHTEDVFSKLTIFKYGKTTVRLRDGDIHSSVEGIETQSPKVRTSAGIGVGSTEADVKAKVPGVSCRNVGERVCIVGSFAEGIHTRFLMDGGRVASVTVALVFD